MGSRQIHRTWFQKGQPSSRIEMFEAPDPAYIYNVYSSLQDQEGRFWFASRNGLAEYFQGRWRLWTTEDGLLENSLYGLARAADGTLLISYYNSLGVSRLRLEGDRLRVVKQLSNGPRRTADRLGVQHSQGSRREDLVAHRCGGSASRGGWSSTTLGRAAGLLSQDMVINSVPVRSRWGALVWHRAVSYPIRFRRATPGIFRCRSRPSRISASGERRWFPRRKKGRR